MQLGERSCYAVTDSYVPLLSSQASAGCGRSQREEISPPYLHPVPAALPTACGVRARLLHLLGALRCLRRARLLLWQRLVLCEGGRIRYAD